MPFDQRYYRACPIIASIRNGRLLFIIGHLRKIIVRPLLADPGHSKADRVWIGTGGGFAIGTTGGFQLGINGGFDRNTQ